MAKIPEEIVEGTWQDAVDQTAEEAEALTRQFTGQQPELARFVAESLGESRHEALELALRIASVVYLMFERTHGPIPRVTGAQVEAAHVQNRDMLESLDASDEEAVERRINMGDDFQQPHVMMCIVEALTDTDDDEDDPEDEERYKPEGDDAGVLFLVSKTVVDALDNAVGRAPRAEA